MKKNYRKKPSGAARLSANDIMTRHKLKAYQDGYALAMAKYGLKRGIVGSEAQYLSCTSSGETTFMSTFLSLTLKQMFEASGEHFFR